MAKKPSWRKNLRQHGMIWLLFLPVLLLGICLVYFAGEMVFMHLRALQWQPTPAVLQERGVDHAKSPNTSHRTSSGSRISASYSYQFQGQNYIGKQLGFSRIYSRSIGASLDDWDEELDRTLGQVGNELQAWVNPSYPAQSVVFNRLRWTEVGILLGFGLLLIWAGCLFLFGKNRPAKPEFSWRAVLTMWAIGLPFLVLAPLLWRDNHPIWAFIVCLPCLLALNGCVHGWRLHRAQVNKRD